MIRLRGEPTCQMGKENIVKQNQGEEPRQQNERGKGMRDALPSACTENSSSFREVRPKLCSQTVNEHKSWFWRGFSAQVSQDMSQWRWFLWGPPNTGKQGGAEHNHGDPSLERSPGQEPEWNEESVTARCVTFSAVETQSWKTSGWWRGFTQLLSTNHST